MFVGLQKLFKVGQMVVVKVLSVNKRSDGKHDVKLSMKPEDIHGNFKASMIHKDLVSILILFFNEFICYTSVVLFACAFVDVCSASLVQLSLKEKTATRLMSESKT